ncbi:TRAP transporter large permease subunit [Flavonifractor plautii]|nr:TRAP transporter large permease subunit [Flavonifractor plautii]
MHMGIYLFLLLFALMFSGMPIALGVGMAAILTTGIWGQIGLELIFQQYYQGVNSFALLAVPLFMLAGELMTRLGLVDDIILLAKLLVGRMRGSLAQINIVASVFSPRCPDLRLPILLPSAVCFCLLWKRRATTRNFPWR